MITQTKFPFQYVAEKKTMNLSAFAGLPLYVDLFVKSGLARAGALALNTKTQGWPEGELLLSLILLNLAGGTCVEDIDRLEKDAGLAKLMRRIRNFWLPRKERRALERQSRGQITRAFPSVSVLRRFLESFHDAAEEKLRMIGKAFIPKPSKELQKLIDLNKTVLNFAQKNNPEETATLDIDATLVPTHKSTALYCYKDFKAYQPFNVYWHELGMMVHSEFRDGNVPAGYEQLRVLQAGLEKLPVEIKKVYLRSDTAGHEWALLKYCAKGLHPKFGVIEFTISCDVTASFKSAVKEVDEQSWKPITYQKGHQTISTHQEWAEVCFVPNAVALMGKSAPTFRYIAIREKMSFQEELPGIEPQQLDLPFQTIDLQKKSYKLFGIVTNRTEDGLSLIHWHRERCGHSEKAHSTEKSELAGGQLPSAKFGANAAWWQIMILAFNIHALMKNLALPKELKTKSLKGLRFSLINLPGQVIEHGRNLLMKLEANAFALVETIRRRIAELKEGEILLSG